MINILLFSNNWPVREATLQLIKNLILEFPKNSAIYQFAIENKFQSLVLIKLNDEEEDVRMSAVSVFKLLTFESNLISSFQSLQQNESENGKELIFCVVEKILKDVSSVVKKEAFDCLIFWMEKDNFVWYSFLEDLEKKKKLKEIFNYFFKENDDWNVKQSFVLFLEIVFKKNISFFSFIDGAILLDSFVKNFFLNQFFLKILKNLF